MKKLFHLFACAAICIVAVASTGCSDKTKEGPASEIIVSGDANVAVTKAGETKTITFAANYDWSAKSTLTPTGDWCTISPATGKAGTACTITVTINANDVTTERKAVVAITTTKEPNLPKEVKFTQAANASEIVISGETNVAVAKAGETKTITFSSSYDWTAKSTLTPTGDWCTISPATGKAGTACTITVTVAASTAETERTAVVAIATTKEPNQAKEVKFTQGANTDPKDVTVKIDDANSMILHDRNLGATKIGELGTWYTYAEAMSSCPNGYHLLTATEFVYDLSTATGYETTEQLKNSNLKLPVTGGYYEDGAIKSPAYGYYWLDGEGADEETLGFAVKTIDDGGYIAVPWYPVYKKTSKLQVRCVKDAQ